MEYTTWPTLDIAADMNGRNTYSSSQDGRERLSRLRAATSNGGAETEFSAMNTFPLKETIGYELPEWKDATKRFLKDLGVIE